jgi:hypothetical protein
MTAPTRACIRLLCPLPSILASQQNCVARCKVVGLVEGNAFRDVRWLGAPPRLHPTLLTPRLDTLIAKTSTDQHLCLDF